LATAGIQTFFNGPESFTPDGNWIIGEAPETRGIFVGAGFTIAIVIMAGIREQLKFSDVPDCLDGAPITLITAGLLTLAFMGFAGMIK